MNLSNKVNASIRNLPKSLSSTSSKLRTASYNKEMNRINRDAVNRYKEILTKKAADGRLNPSLHPNKVVRGLKVNRGPGSKNISIKGSSKDLMTSYGPNSLMSSKAKTNGLTELYKKGYSNSKTTNFINKSTNQYKKLISNSKNSAISYNTKPLGISRVTSDNPITQPKVLNPKNIYKPKTSVGPGSRISQKPINQIGINKSAVNTSNSVSKSSKMPELKFGESETFSSSDMKKMQSNFSKAFNTSSSSQQNAWMNAGSDYTQELLRKNAKMLGM